MKLILGSIGLDDITVYCPSDHPAYNYWKECCVDSFMEIESDIDNLRLRKVKGDYLFLISCLNIVGDDIRRNFRHCVVLHESDLPRGRGWSPMAWQILEGKNDITVSAIKCDDPVDSGDIIKQSVLRLDGTELYQDIHRKCFEVKSALMLSIVGDQTLDRKDADIIQQRGDATYYRRRTPEDSRIDPDQSFAAQFDLLRICEPRFPAFFEHRGCRYNVTLERA